MKRVVLMMVTLLCAAVAQADEAKIRRVVEAKLSGVRVEGVERGPAKGLWEVRFRSREGINIVYTDDEATRIFVGNIYDATSDRNLTEERLRKLTAIKFGDLPLDSAVTVKRGNGRRVLAVFSDPYCPACQAFEKELFQVDDVTVHYFMYPVIRPELADHSRAVWCSKDRAKAWLDLALHRKQAGGDATCKNPIDQLVEYGRSLGVNSTPTLFLANGERMRGGMPAAALRTALDDAAKDVAKK